MVSDAEQGIPHSGRSLVLPLRWPTPSRGHTGHTELWAGAGDTYRPVDVLPDEEVEHGQSDVGQQLPQLPGQQHPQHPVLRLQVDPAPAHRHVRGVVADLL